MMHAETTKPITFAVKAYTKKELRALYGIPESTFKRWLKAVPDLKSGRNNYLTIPQVILILKFYGVPGQREFI